MNRRSIFLSVVFFLVFFSECKKNDDTVTEEAMDVSPSSLSFGKDAENKTFGITSNAHWTVSKSNDWLSVNPASGEGNGNVTVSVIANTGTDVRNGTVTVTTKGGKEKKIQVTQGGIAPFIMIDPATATVECTGGDVTVTVTTSGAWTAQIPADKSWVTLNAAETTATQAVFNVGANGSTDERFADITFKLDGIDEHKTFRVTQDGIVPFIEINPDEDAVEAAGGKVTVAVTASGTWTSQIPSDKGWVTLIAAETTATQAVFNVEANPADLREAVIIFQLDGSEEFKTFTLTQNGVFIEINSEEATIAIAGGKVTVAVTASGAWTAQIPSDKGWVTLNAAETTATLAVFTVVAHDSWARSVDITFKLDGSERSVIFKLKQEGLDINSTGWVNRHRQDGFTLKATTGLAWSNLTHIWDGIIRVDNGFASEYSPALPNHIIWWEMDKVCTLTRMKLWPLQWGGNDHTWNGFQPKEFEVWGRADEPPAAPEAFDTWTEDWTLLGAFNSDDAKPSAPGVITEDDLDMAKNPDRGIEFIFDTLTPVKHVRIRIKSVYSGTTNVRTGICEIKFLGME